MSSSLIAPADQALAEVNAAINAERLHVHEALTQIFLANDLGDTAFIFTLSLALRAQVLGTYDDDLTWGNPQPQHES